MKPFLVIVCFIVSIATTNCSQKIKEKDIPEPVKESFSKTYGSPHKVKWEKEAKNEYEVSFVQHEREISVIYSNKGIIKETETVIKVQALPAPVMEYILKNYSKPVIRKAEIIIKKDGRSIYEVEVNKKELLIDPSGKLLETDS